jgi:hypothetical protein
VDAELRLSRRLQTMLRCRTVLQHPVCALAHNGLPGDISGGSGLLARIAHHREESEGVEDAHDGHPSAHACRFALRHHSLPPSLGAAEAPSFAPAPASHRWIGTLVGPSGASQHGALFGAMLAALDAPVASAVASADVLGEVRSLQGVPRAGAGVEAISCSWDSEDETDESLLSADAARPSPLVASLHAVYARRRMRADAELHDARGHRQASRPGSRHVPPAARAREDNVIEVDLAEYASRPVALDAGIRVVHAHAPLHVRGTNASVLVTAPHACCTALVPTYPALHALRRVAASLSPEATAASQRKRSAGLFAAWREWAASRREWRQAQKLQRALKMRSALRSWRSSLLRHSLRDGVQQVLSQPEESETASPADSLLLCACERREVPSPHAPPGPRWSAGRMQQCDMCSLRLRAAVSAQASSQAAWTVRVGSRLRLQQLAAAEAGVEAPLVPEADDDVAHVQVAAVDAGEDVAEEGRSEEDASDSMDSFHNWIRLHHAE